MAAVTAATATGYLVYKAFLIGFSAQLLTVAIFAFFLLQHLKSPRERMILLSWTPDLGPYTLWHAIAWFAYWYAFWLGLLTTEASIAMAFIALTAIVTPAAVRLYRKSLDIGSILKFVMFGGTMLTGIALMKINLPFSETEQYSRKIQAIETFPVFCMLLAVLAEAIQEVLKVAAADGVKSRKINQPYRMMNISPEEQAIATITIQSIPICIALGILMLALHGSNDHFFPQNFQLSILLALSWFTFWLLSLSWAGNYVRQRLINPLIPDGFDHEALPPWLALRPLLYLGICLAFVWLISEALPQSAWFACNAVNCNLATFDFSGDFRRLFADPTSAFIVNPDLHLTINLALESEEKKASYWLGIALVSAVFFFRFIYFWRFGFSIHDQAKYKRR